MSIPAERRISGQVKEERTAAPTKTLAQIAERLSDLGALVSRYGLGLVIFWIGAMKFTAKAEKVRLHDEFLSSELHHRRFSTWRIDRRLLSIPCREVDDGRFCPYGRRRDQDRLGRELSGACCGALETQPSRVI
jgi:hypothetical protein